MMARKPAGAAAPTAAADDVPYTFDELAAHQTPAVRDILRHARALIRTLVPDAEERAHRGWKNVVYGRTPLVGQPLALAPHRAHVNLYIGDGATLDDPDGLLEGTGKRMRHVKLRSVSDVGRPELRELLERVVAGGGGEELTAKPGRRVSDAAVREATGRGWEDWFAALDAAGAKGQSHRELVVLMESMGASPWWQQMVAVSYEQARGVRVAHEKPDGFAVGATKIVRAPADVVWSAWMDADARARWLPEGTALATRTATAPRSARFDWPAGGRVMLYLYPKGADRVQVAVQHERLSDADAAARKKLAWRERLGRLVRQLEGPP